MRKINLAQKPAELTQEEELKLINEYKANQKSVWRKPYIVDALLKMTYNKCAYSEAKLQVGGAYMDVDHFHPKSLYVDEVAHWGNLLPSTKTSNSTKGEFDTGKQPIINPLIDEPTKFIRFVGCVCMIKRGLKTSDKVKAENSIKKYALNSSHFVEQRSDIISRNDKDLKLLRIEIDNGVLDGDEIQKKVWMTRLKTTLSTAMITEPYSVCIGQAIKDNIDFKHIKTVLQSKHLLVGSLWNYIKFLPQ